MYVYKVAKVASKARERERLLLSACVQRSNPNSPFISILKRSYIEIEYLC